MGKTPIKLDWGKLLPSNNRDPPPELEIVSENQQRDESEDLTDQQLDERIQRMEFNLKALRLPDGGTKLSAILNRLKEERERRKLHRIQRKDAVECWKPTHSRNSIDSDALRDKPHISQSQSLFAAKSFKRREDEPDNSTCNAYDEERRCFSQGNHKSRRQNGLLINNQRLGTEMSVREVPFRSVCSSPVDKDNCGASSGNCKGTASSSSSPSPPEGNLAARFSEKTSPVRRTRNSTKRKAETVVVLDEEDTQPIQPILQVDEAEGWFNETKIYYPSRSHPEAVELCGSDLDCLKPGSHLSSPIMNFYIRYLQRSVSPTGRPRGDYHFFNTYFYNKLEEAVSHKRKDKDSYYARFRRWWKGVDIFQKAYIFLPIHADDHWSLAIICIPAKDDECGPKILHLDSLRYHNSTPIFENTESFLREEWNHLKQSVPPADVPIADRIWKNLSRRISREVIPVPQQKNDSDCGLFVLYFMERFIEEAPKRLGRENLAMFGRQWFQPEDASGLRERIRQLLCEQFEHAKLEDGGIKSPSSVVDSDGQCSES